SIISFSAGSTTARASSGSRSSISSIEPLMSANTAVTVLRSPSQFSGAGVSITRIGASFTCFAEAASDIPRAVPQSSQNLAAGELSAPDFTQRLDNGLPHSGQNFLPDVLSVLHLGQSITKHPAHRAAPSHLSDRRCQSPQ